MRKLLTILVAAGVLAVVPLPASLVERWYTGRVYPLIQHGATSASNLVGIVLLDAAIGAVFLALLTFSIRDVRSAGLLTAAGRTARRLLVVGGSVYLAFLVLWGFNYRRLPLRERLPFDAERVTAASLTRLAGAAAGGLNGLHAPAHAAGWSAPHAIDPALARALGDTMRELGASFQPVPARPKRSVLDWYFRRAGVGGMTDPFFLETLVASDLLPFERPFVIAHEWSHLAGLADEGEANLAGWLACLRGSPAHQYSGWLFMYSEALAALPARDRAAVAAQLTAGPRADLAAIRDRIARQVNPTVSTAGWRVYDSYLKANRVEAGAASYGEVIRLALGLRAAQVY